MTGNITAANVDANYGLFINNKTTDAFDPAGGIMLTRELNSFRNGMRNSSRRLWYVVLLSSITSVRILNPEPSRLARCPDKGFPRPYVETNCSLPRSSPASGFYRAMLRAPLLARAQPPARIQTIRSHLRVHGGLCSRRGWFSAGWCYDEQSVPTVR